MTRVAPGRHYLRGQVVPFEEDMTHEFKGHRTVSLDDRLPVGAFGPKVHHNGEPGGLVNTRQHWSKVSLLLCRCL